MIDTGGTIVKAAETLFEQRRAGRHRGRDARHPQRPGGRAADGSRASPRSSSPTRCRSPTERRFDKLTVLSIAPLLARAIREVFNDGSVTSMFEGDRV